MIKSVKRYCIGLKKKIKNNKVSNITIKDIIVLINKYECLDIAIEKTKYFVTIYNVDEFRNHESLEKALIRLYEAANNIIYEDERLGKYFICEGKQIFNYNDFIDLIDKDDGSSQITKFLKTETDSVDKEIFPLEFLVNCKMSKSLSQLSSNEIIANVILQVAYMDVLNKYFNRFRK